MLCSITYLLDHLIIVVIHGTDMLADAYLYGEIRKKGDGPMGEFIYSLGIFILSTNNPYSAQYEFGDI